MGVFDRNSYGVYNDQDKFVKSKNYWNASSLKHQEFETRDEALRFARTGVAQLNGITENAIPSMQFAIIGDKKSKLFKVSYKNFLNSTIARVSRDLKFLLAFVFSSFFNYIL